MEKGYKHEMRTQRSRLSPKPLRTKTLPPYSLLTEYLTLVAHNRGSPTPWNSVAPAGCAMVHLESDTVYLQTPQMKGSVPQDCLPSPSSDNLFQFD